MMRALDVRPVTALLAVVLAMMLLVVSVALFTGWNPDQLPYAIRFIQAVIAAIFAAGGASVAAIGAIQTLRQWQHDATRRASGESED